MMDRTKIVSVLHKRFPAASQQQLAWATNAIVGLGDEWEEVAWDDPEMACAGTMPAGERRYLADGVREGAEFRIFRKRWPDVRGRFPT